MKHKYERAQALMSGIYTKSIAYNTTLFPIWIDNTDHFWYERETSTGKEYRLVNAENVTNTKAFDHNALAFTLGEIVKQEVDATNLPISNVSICLEPKSVKFTAFEKSWTYDADSGSCSAEEESRNTDCVISPNGKYGIFIRSYNLWLRNLGNGDEQPLTTDGEEEYAYGVGVVCLAPVDFNNVQVRWSPDSTRIFAVQRDTRQVKKIPLMHHVPQDGSFRPYVTERKEAYPGDDHVETLRLLAIDVGTGFIREASYRQIPVTRNTEPFFDSNLGWWSIDSHRAYFVDMERDYRTVRVVEFDTHTGLTRVLFEEFSKTHISLMLNSDESPALLPLPETSELLWYSERSGWAHLYLYDLESGKLKNTVTQGEWLVRDIVHLDFERRELFVQTAGRNSDLDPYYRDLCRIDLDTGNIDTLISGDYEYWAISQKNQGVITAKGLGLDVQSSCGVSPSGRFAVVTRSRADDLPVSLLLDTGGRNILKLETASTSALLNNWQWPEPVKLIAADGKTDIYGLVFRPSDFSPEQSYPVISHVYNTPDLTWVSKGAFTNSHLFGSAYLDAAALAELGFIVVQIDGRGTPFRSKKFIDECYGWTESASNIDDHIAGIKQLGERYTYMDLTRVGITSHCAGGMGVVSSMCHPSKFYKVAVSSMPYDSRFLGAALWSEKYEGISCPASEHHYPEEVVLNLHGKLLLMNSLSNPLAPVEGTLRIVDALEKNNKDFDLLLLPTLAHGYMVRRAWDYLVKNLLEVEPPTEFKLNTIFG